MSGTRVSKANKRRRRFILFVFVIAAICAAVYFGVEKGIYKTIKDAVRSVVEGSEKIRYEDLIAEEENFSLRAKSTAIAGENAEKSRFAVYKRGILCASGNRLVYVGAEGKAVWETETEIVDPLLDAEGGYILIAEKGSGRLCLYKDDRQIYSTECPDNIKAIKVSAHGDAVLVTDRQAYRGGVSVYNKSGRQIYSWSSGSAAVISADISSSSRRIAVSLIDTSDVIKSQILFFDINQSDSYALFEADNSVIYDVSFSGNMLTAFCDDRLVTLSLNGKVMYDTSDKIIQVTHSAADDFGAKIIAYDDGNIPMLGIYSRNGDLIYSFMTDGVTDHIDINGDNIVYNLGRDVFFGDVVSENMLKYEAPMDVKNLLILTKDTFAAVYSNSMEIVTFESG